MRRSHLFFGLGILLLFALNVQARDQSSHVITIKFIKPISFEVADLNDPSLTQKSISVDQSPNVSKLIWNHPIPNKKVTVAFESFMPDNFILNANLKDSKNSDRQIQIGKTATDLFLSDYNHAGLIQLEYRSIDLNEHAEFQKIAYTVTDAI
ncbi:hypothetical protein HQ585_04240 [candidate division KSB1 bacterium]|nr:hypothetical protein [candidate division KSB1 bacterium]